jgi:hypothetical protein
MPGTVVEDPPSPSAGHTKVKRSKDRPEPVKVEEPEAAPDAAALRAKFQAATREYKAYKERNGPRLETEWTDLASMVGYLSTPEKRIAFDKKVDRLRARMRE